MQLFKAAIFDMDGLLIDSERIIMQACIAAATEVGIPYSQAQFIELIGRNATDSTRVMTEQLGGEANFNQVLQRVDSMLAARPTPFPLKTGALETIEFFHQQAIPCAVASSSYKNIIQTRLTLVGVFDYFSAITSGDEVSNGKPHPDIYLLALKKLGYQADDCIAFEDSELGARAAIAAGLKVIVVPDLKTPSDFVQENCFMIAESLSHALSYIEKSLR